LLIGSIRRLKDLSEWYLARARVDEVLHGADTEGNRRARRGGAAGSRYLLLGESSEHVTILQMCSCSIERYTRQSQHMQSSFTSSVMLKKDRDDSPS
jgi:hypothetical protein